MIVANLFVEAMLVYFIGYTVHLIGSKKYRDKIVADNEELRKLRKIPKKSIKEQKEFLNIKHPKGKKWAIKDYGMLVFSIAFFGLLFYALNMAFGVVGIKFKLWQAILFIIVFPLAYNVIMAYFGLEKDSLLNYIGIKIGDKK